MRTSIVIPAYNEEKRIAKTLKDLKSIRNAEIIVVCNGCTDATATVARNVKGVKVIELKEKNKGNAVLQGLKRTRGRYIGFVDADGAFSASAVRKILAELSKAEMDCVIGSKWKGERGKKLSVVHGSGRHMATRLWNFLVRVLLGLNFADTQAGLKFMRRRVYKTIDKNFVCKGFAFDVELLYKIKKAGYSIREFYAPIKTIAIKKYKFNLWHTPNMFKELLTLWLSEKLKK